MNTEPEPTDEDQKNNVVVVLQERIGPISQSLIDLDYKMRLLAQENRAFKENKHRRW